MATCSPVYKAYPVAISGYGQCYESGVSYYRWGEPTSSSVRATIQQRLENAGLYSGPADGAWGANTVKGIMQALKNKGYYSGPVDGIPGSATVTGVGNYACNWAGAVDADYAAWNQLPSLSNVAAIPADGAGDRFWGRFAARLEMGL